MTDREKVIKGVHDARRYLEDRELFDRTVGVHIDALNDVLALLKEQEDLGTELTNAVELIHKKNERIEKLLKGQKAVEPLMEGKVPMENGRSGSETAEEKSTMSALEAVVYCGDCKHGSLYCTEDVCGETLIECNRPDLDAIEIHVWNWFCADGEMKGEKS